MLFCLQCVIDGSNATNLNIVIIQVIFNNGVKQHFDVIFRKLLSFGVNGIDFFRFSHRCYHPNSSLICFVHYSCPQYGYTKQAWLSTFQALPIVNHLERTLYSLYKCFSNSPKKHLELVKVGEILETKNLKILTNVKTPWIFILTPFKRVLQEYCPLLECCCQFGTFA